MSKTRLNSRDGSEGSTWVKRTRIWSRPMPSIVHLRCFWNSSSSGETRDAYSFRIECSLFRSNSFSAAIFAFICFVLTALQIYHDRSPLLYLHVQERTLLLHSSQLPLKAGDRQFGLLPLLPFFLEG